MNIGSEKIEKSKNLKWRFGHEYKRMNIKKNEWKLIHSMEINKNIKNQWIIIIIINLKFTHKMNKKSIKIIKNQLKK